MSPSNRARTPDLAGGAHDERISVSMLLDNHYGPEARVAFEIGLLRDAGISAKIVAWDRRANPAQTSGGLNDDLVRFAVPAPSGGGWHTLLALARFGARVWRNRRALFGGTSLLMVHDIYLLPLGWALARDLDLPLIYDAHEEFRRSEARRYPTFVLRLAAAAESRLARRAAMVVVPGSCRTSRWRGVIERPPIVVPNFGHREQAPASDALPRWDLFYAGTISDVRRLDLLVELARRRPDIEIAIAGDGHGAAVIEQASADLPNLTYLGWQEHVDGLFELTRSVYYGLDPSHSYSEVACPNTLYQALRHRKPLVFFCGGEPAEVASEFTIGIRCAPSVTALVQAVDEALANSDWQFDIAWRALWDRADLSEFAEAIASAA